MSKDIVEMEAAEAYRLVLYQVVRWLEHSVDPKNSRVFFVTASPTHTESAPDLTLTCIIVIINPASRFITSW
jgi:hypothetical protein